VGLALAALCAPTVLADRSSENMDPAYMYEKAKQFDKAALYYHRALRGLREIYIAFHWNGDPAANAPGKYSTEYVQIPKEMAERYEKCVSKGKLGPNQLKRMEYLNYLWMSEMVDEEAGGQRTACAIIAPEAEKRGDFRLAEFLRRGEARYYRVVAIPFHEKCAREFESSGQEGLAACHRQAARAYERRARRADRIAQGNKVLMAVRGLGGPGRYIGELRLYPAKVGPVGFQYIPRRLFTKEGKPRGAGPEEATRLLKEEGLKHADESVRSSAVAALAELGAKEAVRSALHDSSATVRQAAAQALSTLRWAEGWAACHRHSDARVRAAVAPLFMPAKGDVLARTHVVTALMCGLGPTSSKTAAVCQAALERITGKKMQPNQWAGWWKGLGNARPGLIRTGPGVPPEIDETIDFGAWWQSAYQRAPNPLMKYDPPATIRWDGYLVVPRSGEYRFYARNCGEGRHSGNAVRTPGRVGFPALYLSAPSAKVTIAGKTALPHPRDAVQDPCGGVRLDFGEPMRLEEGLHKIHVEFEYRSRRTGFGVPQPCLRLYWSGGRFPREVVPAHCLVTKD